MMTTWVEALDLSGIYLPAAPNTGIPDGLVAPAKGRRAADLLQQPGLFCRQRLGHKAKFCDM